MSIVYSSKRPASIAKENQYFAAAEKKPKLCTGPTRPKPGPILPTSARDAVSEVRTSAPSQAAATAVSISIKKYKNIKAATLYTTSFRPALLFK